jgi:alkaline phosphatase D
MLRRQLLKQLLRGYLAQFPLFSPDAPLSRIAFGSCNRTHLPQPLWPHILNKQPDLFLWLGDVVYADTNSVDVMRREYEKQLAKPDYAALQKAVPILGIWDDHDYGQDNQGKNNPIKAQSQQLFLDFLNEPETSQRRSQRGIYAAYNFGKGDQQVKLILLDTRYHRDRPGTGRADLLGKAQWRWLENELKTSTATINIIASSFSVLSTQIPRAEEWKDFKWARRRLFHLLHKHDVSGVLFLTGDRHFAAHLTERIGGHQYHEFMSSGMTHYLTRPRVSAVLRRYYGRQNSFFGLNFSVLEFDWRHPVRVHVTVYDDSDTPRLSRSLQLSDGYFG